MASPNSLTFQAKITKPDGSNLEDPAVNFTFKYTDALGTCVVYEENFTGVVMTGSKGLVSLQMGAGLKTFPPAVVSLYDIFNFGTALSCQGGIPTATTTPTSVQNRKVIMQFDDGSGLQTLPSMNLNAVPYSLHSTMAINSNQLGGVAANQYTKYSDITAAGCVAGQALRYTGASFVCENITGAGVATVTATAPVVSSGGANPNISLAKGTSLADGYLASSDFSVFSNKQNALGYTPLNAASNLSDVASADVSRINLGLGNSATKNVGTVAGTVAAGDDPRLTGAVLGSTTLSGDVTGTVSTTVVSTVGGKTAANISTSVNDTQAATNLNTASAIVRRNASGDFTAGTINATTFSGTNASATNVSTKNMYLYDNTNTNFIIFKAPLAGITNYTLTLPPAVGTNGQVLSTSASGDLSWTTPSAGTLTSVTASAPLVSSGGASPDISIAKATATVSGYLASSDFSTFNNKLTSALSSTYIFVGSAGGVATAVAMSGDATISNAGVVTLSGSGASAGSYSNVTVDTKGRVISGVVSQDLTKVTGTLAIANGGTGAITKILAFNALSPLTAKGQIVAHDGTDSVALTAGTDGYVLTADSTQASGVKWAAVVTGTGTTNKIPKFTAAGAIGDSAITDNGTTIVATRSIATTTNTVGAAAVNLALSNSHVLATPGTPVITLSNMSDGGVYNIVIADTATSRTYTFAGCNASYFKPANAPTTVSTRTVYGIMTIYNGSTFDCYITWSTGFQ